MEADVETQGGQEKESSDSQVLRGFIFQAANLTVVPSGSSPFILS